MMREIKRTVVTVETVQRTTIRQMGTKKIVLCESCAAEIKGHSAAQITNRPSAESDVAIEEEMLSDRSRSA